MANRKPTKNEKRRAKQKTVLDSKPSAAISAHQQIKSESDNDMIVLHVDNETDDSLFKIFLPVFEKFENKEETAITKAGDVDSSDSVTNNIGNGDEGVIVKLSKKQKKLQNRLTAAELKQLVQRPDAVESHDVTSSDPRLLVYLKSYRNTVPVPRHWCAIRKYLQGKRGVEKVPFQLPEFIAETGIAKIRESVLEQDALKKGKQKTREKVKPKMGKIDIDYQVLHDAFFKYQTKPKMSSHGELYYEGKEFEVNMKERRPGMLSADLIAALGMAENTPPPWLINMQRYGLPPSYPNLKVPGLNAPLPVGAAFGYHTGGWGKPPTDEYGRPLYGDVFGVVAQDEMTQSWSQVDKVERWGGMDAEVEPEYVDEDENDEDEGEGEQQNGRSVYETGGVATPHTLDGSQSIRSMETPNTVDLRKRTGQETPDTLYDTPIVDRELYTVVEERAKTGSTQKGLMFGSDRAYVMPHAHHDSSAVTAGSESVSSHLTAAEEEATSTTVVNERKRKAEPVAVLKKIKEFKF